MGFISRHRLGEKKSFLLKNWPNFLHTFSFYQIFKKNTLKASYTCHHSESEKTGHIFNRKNLWGFQYVFIRNILHLKKRKTLIFSQFSQFFLSLKYKYTSICNYLNKYTNLNNAHYIRYTSLWNLYKKCIPYLCSESWGMGAEEFRKAPMMQHKLTTLTRTWFNPELYRRNKPEN